MFRTNNPALKNDVFAAPQTWASFTGEQSMAADRPRTMTLSGTLLASGVLVSICTAVAILGWGLIMGNRALLFPMWGVGALGGLVLAFVMFFKPQTSPIVAPMYAAAEGLFVAAASVAWTAYAASGKAAASVGADLVIQAAVLTFGISGAMLVAYATKLIKPSQRLLGAIAAITGGVIIFGVVMFLVSMFFPGRVIAFWESPLGIPVAGFIVVLAAANLVLDFAQIDEGVRNQSPKHMEWYGGFCLLVTLVWLYVSILRLLALLRRD